MKVSVSRAEVRVRGEFWEQGSFLRGTIEGGCTRIDLQLAIETPSTDDARLGDLVRNAERVCFVSQAVTNRVPVELSVSTNGRKLELSRGET
jgi:organic hydroperoxide reductase OsmC/OhrA